MRTPERALAALRACALELNPAQTHQRLHDLIRGGLPASSTNDGRGTNEPPLPTLEQLDIDTLAKLDAYDRDLDALADRALALRRRQRDILYRSPGYLSKNHVLAELGKEPLAVVLRWCQSCTRITLADGSLHHCPIAGDKQGGKDGVLCPWCIKHRLNADSWPDLADVRAHAEGRPVRMKPKPQVAGKGARP